MYIKFIFLYAYVIISLTSCVFYNHENDASKLENDFINAYSDYHKSLKGYDHWNKRLHESLKMYGDDKFASVLRKQPTDVQYAVLNIMGYTDISIYDQYPVTNGVLSAVPKY
jgi:hypothetical protein